MSMAMAGRGRPSGHLREIYTVAYYGSGNRFILSEEIVAYGEVDANARAERAMPPGAVTYKVSGGGV